MRSNWTLKRLTVLACLIFSAAIVHADSSDGITLSVNRVDAESAKLDWSGGASTCCSGQNTPGCDDTAVQACVCSQYSFCCSSTWFDFCAQQVEPLGCGICPAYEVSRSADPAQVRAPVNRLGTTADTTWSDFPEPGKAFYYHVSNAIDFEASAAPDGFLAGTPTPVLVQATIPLLPLLDSNSVKFYRLDANQNNTGPALCSLLDNGNGANGDTTAGDGIFSCIASLTETAGSFAARVQATVGTSPVYSAALVLSVVNAINPTDAALVVTRQQDAQNIWNSISSTMGDTLAARIATAAQIEQLTGVAAAGVSSDNSTIWIEYTSGINGGLMLNPTGTRGSAPNICLEDDGGDPRFPSNPLLGAPPNLVGDPSFTDNAKLLIWDAYNDEFAPFDEAPDLTVIFEDFGFTVTTLTDTQCTIETIGSFTQYDTVAMITHGGVDQDGKVMFLTRSVADGAAILANVVNLLTGRLTVVGGVFAAKPALIAALGGEFENGIIYNGSCCSAANGTMANAFTRKGANTYFGYSKVVNSDFAQSSAIQLFNHLVTMLNRTGESFDAVTPIIDPGTPNAVFTKFGDNETAYE